MTDRTVNVFVLREASPTDLERFRAVAPGRIHLTQAEERTALTPEQSAALAEAEVVVTGAACPRDLGAQAPRMRWVHANFAGISDLADRDFWGTDVTMTSARGFTGALPIAEMALTGGMMLSKNLDHAARETATRWKGREVFQPWLLSARTMGIVGLGGIGAHLAGLAKGVGMRVVATRRSATERRENVDGVDVLYPASALVEMARESHFLAVCAASTPQTERLIDAEVLTALPKGAIIMNIARGEVIDEDALMAAVDAGQVGGAYLDVWVGEKEHDPSPRMAEHPRIIMTPHISYRSDVPQQLGYDVFVENLARYLKGEPLTNLVEWERGY